MGGFASYTYPGGNYQSQTGSTGGGFGLDDMTAFYKQMAMRRMAQQDEDRQRRIDMENAAMRRANAPQLGGQAMNGDEQRLRQLQIGAEIAKLQAASAPAPTKMISGPQIIPGQVLDPMAMNAYQRQLYLPQGASMSGGPTGQEEARSRSLGGEVDLDLATEAERRRRAMLGGSSEREGADYGSLRSYGR